MNGDSSDSIISVFALAVSGMSLAGTIFLGLAYRKLKAEYEELLGQSRKNLKRAEDFYDVFRRYSSLRQKLEKVARRHKDIPSNPFPKGS